jgi:LGFP repeat
MISLIRKSIACSVLVPLGAFVLTAVKQTSASSFSVGPQITKASLLPQRVLPLPPFSTARQAIERKYSDLGGEGGFLGKLTMDLGQCPDGAGYYIHYGGGSIYWSPSTGAHEIHGAIREKWKSMGWERSLLGYPMIAAPSWRCHYLQAKASMRFATYRRPASLSRDCGKIASTPNELR